MNVQELYDNKSVCIQWARENIGFGELVFHYKGDKLMCDNETMSKEFVKEVLCALVDEAEFTE